MSAPPVRNPDTHDGAWDEIEALLERLAEAARNCGPAEPFYGELLTHTCRVMAVDGGAVWLTEPRGLRLAHQVHLERSGVVADHVARRRHADVLDRVLQSGQAELLPPRSGSELGSGADNPTDHVLLVVPVLRQQRRYAAIELFLRGELDPASHRGYLRLAEALAEIAADFHERTAALQLQEHADWTARRECISRAAHQSLHREQLAYRVVNECRRLGLADRVSLAVHDGHWQLLAVSGVERVERRGNLARRLERLVEVTAGQGERLRYPLDEGVLPELPPQQAEALQALLDETHANGLWIEPLEVETEEPHSDSPRRIGALVLESFEQADSVATARESSVTRGERLGEVAWHLAIALDHALEFQAARSWWRGMWWGRSGPARAWQLGGIGLVVLLLAALVPIPFRLPAGGRLEPVQQHMIFAPEAGNIQSLAVRHGQEVRAGDVLGSIQSPPLEQARQQLEARMAAARQRLAAVVAERLELQTARQRDAVKLHTLTSEQEQLERQLQDNRAELEIVSQQLESLTLVSPIQGQVLTWDLHQALAGRPVSRGEVLLRVADVQGAWRLELELPGSLVGYVREALDGHSQGLPVRFQSVTRPGATYQGVLRELAAATETQSDGQATARAWVDVPAQSGLVLRPGAAITARIQCGWRSLGFVCLRGLVDAARRNLWW